MNFTTQELQHIASLAKLSFNPEEIEHFTQRFSNIINYIDHMNAAETLGVEPMTNSLDVSDEVAPREDSPTDMLAQADALKNAPKKVEGFFGVPKVIES